MKQKRSEYNVVRRKNKFFARLCAVVFIGVLLFSLGMIVRRVYILNTIESPSIEKLFSLWNSADYLAVYEVSEEILENNPFQTQAMTFKGYSSFFLALSQTDMAITINYLDEAINCLRIAMKSASKKSFAQIQYMLGKAYFQKNVVSDYHYYSDLSVKYLEEARKNGFTAPDIPEYLGLGYAKLGMVEESIKSFTEALLVRDSDELLLAIAQQYYNSQRANTAKQYLNKINQESSNELLVLQSRILLGQIYTDEEKYADALKEFQSILEKDANSADAYYGIGVIYEKQGDLVKARSEWRKALKVQVNHPNALKKMANK